MADDGPPPAGDDEGEASPEPSAETPPPKRRGFARRHWILLSLALVLVVIAGSAGGYVYWVNHKLSAIPRFECEVCGATQVDDGSDKATAPKPDKSHALNILLLGVDSGDQGGSVADELAKGTWTPFAHRSDTMMLVHIPADRDSVQLVSIPRDTWVPIDGYPYSDAHGKINAAFAYGGPNLAAKTVHEVTGIDIDHLAIIDWAGFKDLTTALDGVRVYIPETFYDDSQRITWTQGWQTLEGKEALQYVRTRHGLDEGDFGRIDRQQNFLRATLAKLLSQSHNVFSITKVVNSITKYLTIDSGWSNKEIVELAYSLRSIHTDDVTFLTAPHDAGATMIDEQYVVKLLPRQSQRLFDDIKDDNIKDYLDKYPDAALDGDKNVE